MPNTTPNVIVTRGAGNLGAVAPREDGIALLLITAPAGYTVTGSKFTSLVEAEAAGFTETQDNTLNCLVWEHIKDFYKYAPGTTLHVILYADTVTLTNIFTPANTANNTLIAKLQSEGGKIRLVACALNPTTESAPTAGLSADALAAIPLAQTFADLEFTNFRPIDIMLEGRYFLGAAVGVSTAATDLRGTLTAPSVSVMVSRDEVRKTELVANGNSGATNYAEIGSLLGMVASIDVASNIGEVAFRKLLVTKGELSNGSEFASKANEDSAYAKGYIFYRQYTGKDGFFFVDDLTCAPDTNAYSSISRSRTINKSCRLARTAYLDFLLGKVQIDENGKLAPVVVKTYENAMQSLIERTMITAGEISSATVYVNPDQDVLATGRIDVLVSIVPVGYAKEIRVTVQFENPNN